MPISFTLENGAEQLQAFFPKVNTLRYLDNLQVTEIEPLIAFLETSFYSKDIVPEAVLKMRSELETELKEKGKIYIQKDSGLFEAIK